MASWDSLSVSIPGKDLVEQVRGTLETLLIFLDILKSLLQTVEMFLIDFGNPVRALVNALLKLIKQLIASLAQTGLYALYDVPDITKDPNFHRYQGGYQAFTQRFIGSLMDGSDPFRPQPKPGVDKSGFIVIVADAETVFGMLRLMKILLKFFGRDFSSPQYQAPANARVLPAGQKIGTAGAATLDPILQVAAVFNTPLKGLAVEWSLGGNIAPPDPGFADLVGQVAGEFVPPKWLIEKSSRPGGPEVVTAEETTLFEDRRGRTIKRRAPVQDEYGDVFRKFEKYMVIEPGLNPELLVTELGVHRFIDKDVELEKTYYYRVRAFSGDLVLGPSGEISLSPPEKDLTTGALIQPWPAASPSEPPIMGRPTGILTGRLPKVPANFDTISNLENLFLVAYSLGFHLTLASDATFDATTGLPTGDTSPIQIGRGSLQELGGVLTSVAMLLAPPLNLRSTTDPVTGKYSDVYWDNPFVKQQAKRMAQAVGSAFLENSGFLESFRTLMVNPLSSPISPPAGTNFSGSLTLEEALKSFLMLPESFPSTYAPKVYNTYDFAYTDPSFRLSVLSCVSFIKSFTLGGTTPDWQSASVLRDIIPWSGQFLYEMLAKIDALSAAFKSISDEMQAYIDSLIRKIDALERFLAYLIQILNYLDMFSAGFYVLKVPSTDGGIPDWVTQIQTAGGDKPPSGPGGYTAGVAFAWSAPDIEAFTKAIDILF